MLSYLGEHELADSFRKPREEDYTNLAMELYLPGYEAT
jgi:hypothetical protein